MRFRFYVGSYSRVGFSHFSLCTLYTPSLDPRSLFFIQTDKKNNIVYLDLFFIHIIEM